jgi:hypothetical protein
MLPLPEEIVAGLRDDGGEHRCCGADCRMTHPGALKYFRKISVVK